MSCLARERAFEFNQQIRYACPFTVSVLRWLRYGVLYDIANRVLQVNRFQSATRASTVFGRATPIILLRALSCVFSGYNNKCYRTGNYFGKKTAQRFGKCSTGADFDGEECSDLI